MSKINVTVRYAILNKSFEVVGQMKNYVKIRYINGLDVIGQYKTKKAEGEKNKQIVWNQTISIPLGNKLPNSILEFKIFDDDILKDDLCGKAIFNLSQCYSFEQGHHRYNIKLYSQDKTEVNGQLHITTKIQ